MWYPYLWMLGGEILELHEGHPTEGVYWFPTYNSSEGVRAMEFLKQQIDAGIQPQNSQLAWELITIIAEPEILGPFIQQYAYLPTQRTLGEGPASEPLKESIPFFEEMVSMIPYGRSRPSLAEYPDIAEHIHQAIQQVYNGSALPEDALNMAAAKSADSLGW